MDIRFFNLHKLKTNVPSTYVQFLGLAPLSETIGIKRSLLKRKKTRLFYIHSLKCLNCTFLLSQVMFQHFKRTLRSRKTATERSQGQLNNCVKNQGRYFSDEHIFEKYIMVSRINRIFVQQQCITISRNLIGVQLWFRNFT